MQTRFSGQYDNNDIGVFVEILIWSIVLMVVIVLGYIGVGVL